MINVLLIIISLFVLWYIITKSQHPKNSGVVRTKCIKQPDKDCTYQIKFTDNSIQCSGHFGCCKVIDQLKAINKFGCEAIPNKNYNGISITKQFQDQSLK